MKYVFWIKFYSNKYISSITAELRFTKSMMNQQRSVSHHRDYWGMVHHGVYERGRVHDRSVVHNRGVVHHGYWVDDSAVGDHRVRYYRVRYEWCDDSGVRYGDEGKNDGLELKL